MELIELDIASCWGQQPEEVLQQKDDGPFVDVISHLDELAQHMPTRKAWDELVFPPHQDKPSTPHQSSHLRYIMGCTMDLGSCLPPLQLCIPALMVSSSVYSEASCTKGVCSPMIPLPMEQSDLSPAKDVSAQELGNGWF